MKITAVLLKLGQTKVIISPLSPKITEKRERQREREKKRLATVFSFYSVDFGEKNRCQRSLTAPYSERPGFHKSRYICIFIIQHIDTLPKYGQKLLMYVGPHDVYPTIDVNFSMLTRECKNKKLVDNVFSSNFVLLSMC